MQDQVRLHLWLDLMRTLLLPKSVMLVGAGPGTGDWIQRLLRWEINGVSMIEAEDSQFQHLQSVVPARPEWQIRKQVVALDSEAVSFYQASNIAESGLIEPEELRTLLPNLKTRTKQTRQAVSLGELLEASPSNWLVVDCLPARSIIEGALAQLTAVDLIAARVVFDSAHLPREDGSLASLQQLLQAHGFRLLATEAERHPGIGQALFVRDTRSDVSALSQTIEQRTAELQQQREEREEEARRADESRQHLEALALKLKQEQDHAGANALAHKHAIEHVQQQMQHLAQSASVAETIAQERLQEINRLDAQLRNSLEQIQVNTQSRERQAQQDRERNQQLDAWRVESEQKMGEQQARLRQLENQLTEAATRAQLTAEKLALQTERDEQLLRQADAARQVSEQTAREQRKRIEQLKQQLQQLAEQDQSKTAELQRLESALAQANRQLTDLQEQLHQTDLARQTTERVINAQHQQIAQLEEKRQQLEEQGHAHAAELKRIDNERSSTEQRAGELELQLQQNREHQADLLVTAAQQLRQAEELLAQQTAMLEEQLNRLRSELTDRDERLRTQETHMAQLQQQTGDAAQRTEQLQAALTSINQQMADKDTRIAALELKQRSLIAQREKLQRLVDEATSQQTALTQALGEKEHVLTDLQARQAETTVEQARLQMVNERLSAEMTRALAQIDIFQSLLPDGGPTGT